MLSVTRPPWAMKQLLARQELSLNIGGPYGTALHVAIKEKMMASISLLLHGGANIELPDEDGYRVLHLAAADNDAELIRVLIEAKADVNAKLQSRVSSPKQSDGSTPLILNVAAKGDTPAVRLLLQAKAEVTATDRAGRSAISWARELAIEDVLDLLEQAKSGNLPEPTTPTPSRITNVAAAAPSFSFSSSSSSSSVPQSSPRSASPVDDSLERKDAPAATREGLIAAIKAGDASSVTSMARSGPKLLSVIKGRSPLHIAAALPNTDVIDALLSCDADAYAKDKDGLTPFGIAVVSLQEGSLKELLDGTDPRNPLRKPELGQALWIASKELLKHELVVAEVELRAAISSDGKVEAEKKLIEPRRAGDILVRMQLALVTAGADPNGTTGSLAPVYVATLLGRPTLVGPLIAAGARCDPTALLARTWEPGVARLLVEAKADLTIVDDRGMPALHAACRESRADVARVILIDGRSDPEARAGPSSKTPLHCAAEAGCEAAVRVLLESRASLAARTHPTATPNGNATPIHLASAAGHAHVVKQLLEARADPEQRDANGDTSLHVSVRAGHDRVVRLLLDAKAALVSPNQKGYTALHLAAEQGHAALVEGLLRRGAPSDAKSIDGETPLHRAVLLRRRHADDTNMVTLTPEQRASYERIIRWLINAAPHSLDIRDSANRSVADIAARVKDAPLSSLLRTSEARSLPTTAEALRPAPEPPLPPRFPALIRLKKEMAALNASKPPSSTSS
jgi:ankyrin repeat protein